MSDHIKQLSALTALNHMMAGTHFDICTINNVGELLGIEPRGTEAYKVLHPLHCIYWAKMPAELRDAIPGLIQECLGIEPIYRFKTATQEVIDVTAPVRRGFMRLLGGKP